MVQKKQRNKSERSSGIYYRPLFFMIHQWDIYLDRFCPWPYRVRHPVVITKITIKFEISSNTRRNL